MIRCFEYETYSKHTRSWPGKIWVWGKKKIVKEIRLKVELQGKKVNSCMNYFGIAIIKV